MMFVGGLTAYTFVWDLGDVGVGLMTVFNLIALIPMSKEALVSLRDYEAKYKEIIATLFRNKRACEKREFFTRPFH